MCDAPVLPFFESSASILWLGIYPKVPIAGTSPTSCYSQLSLSLGHETVLDPSGSCCLNPCLLRTPHCLLKYPSRGCPSLSMHLGMSLFIVHFPHPIKAWFSLLLWPRVLLQSPLATRLPLPSQQTAQRTQPCFRNSPQHRASWEFSVRCTCVEG